MFDTPAEGGQAQLLTSGIDTVPFVDDDDANLITPGAKPIIDDDDYTPPRWIAKIISVNDAPAAPSNTPQASAHLGEPILPALSSVRPTRERKFYFSEKVLDPEKPRTSTVFYITEEGRQLAAFDPASPPDITVPQGDVEDWVIENRSQEIHTFHIHQTHFVVLERDHAAARENYLRDSVTVPYWDGVSKKYPSVKLRIDFR